MGLAIVLVVMMAFFFLCLFLGVVGVLIYTAYECRKGKR